MLVRTITFLWPRFTENNPPYLDANDSNNVNGLKPVKNAKIGNGKTGPGGRLRLKMKSIVNADKMSETD